MIKHSKGGAIPLGSQIIYAENAIDEYEEQIDVLEQLIKKSKDIKKISHFKRGIEALKGMINRRKEILKKLQEQEKPKSDSNLKNKIQKQIKEIESVNIPKAKKSKAIPQMLDIVEMIAKTPKTKKYNNKESEELNDTIAEIEKLIKAPKKLVKAPKKIMKQSEGYVHKVTNASPAVKQYVEEYKYILQKYKTPATITKHINKLKSEAYEKLMPSDIDDANKLIRDFRASLPPKPVKEKKVTAKKAKAEKPADNSYRGDKKYKPYTAYVKKHKPKFTDPEDIHIIVSELIDKKVPRMSVKILEQAIKDAGYESSSDSSSSDSSSDSE